MKIQRFNLDEGRIWEAIEGLSPFKTTYTLEEVCEKLNELFEENEQLKSYIDTIFEGNSHICKKIDIEDVQFYCERNRDYHYPTCTYKKCFDENNLIGLKEKIRECNE